WQPGLNAGSLLKCESEFSSRVRACEAPISIGRRHMKSLNPSVTCCAPPISALDICVVAIFLVVGLMLGSAWALADSHPGDENVGFEVPAGKNGDAYDRCLIYLKDMRQGCRIIRQCLERMPASPYK